MIAQPPTPRQQKALNILLRGDVSEAGNSLYNVKSESNRSTTYVVYAPGASARCSCLDASRGHECKHAIATKGYRKVRDLVTRSMREGRADEVQGKYVTILAQSEYGLVDEWAALKAQVVLNMFKAVRAEYAAHARQPVTCECVAGQWCPVCEGQADGEQWAA